MPDISDNILGGIIGGVGSIFGGSIAADGAKDAAEAARYVPYNISGGFGTGEYDGYNGTATLGDPWAGIRDYYLGQMGMFNDQLNAFRAPQRSDFYSGGTSPLSFDAWKGQYGDPYITGQTSEHDFYDPITGQWADLRNSIPGSAGKMGFGVHTPEAYQKLLSDYQGEWRAFQDSAEYAKRPQTFDEWWSRRHADETAPELFKGYGDAGVSNTYDDAAARAAYDDYLANGGFGGEFDEEGYNAAVANWKSPEQTIYDRLALLSAEDEQLERNTLENRLFAQGMLGSKGGYHRTRALNNSQAQKALQREQYAVTLAEEIQNQIQRRGLNALNAGIGLEQLPLDYLKLGASVGVSGANAGANAASYLANAAADRGDAISGFFSNLGSNISPGVFTTPTFNPGFGSGSYSTPSYYSPDGGGFGLGTGIFG